MALNQGEINDYHTMIIDVDKDLFIFVTMKTFWGEIKKEKSISLCDSSIGTEQRKVLLRQTKLSHSAAAKLALAVAAMY